MQGISRLFGTKMYIAQIALFMFEWWGRIFREKTVCKEGPNEEIYSCDTAIHFRT